jgi:hypothetical protein
MEDIAPGLLNRIRASFKRNIEGNSKISKLYQAIKDGTATYIDAEEYAVEVGTALADAFGANISSAVLPDGKMHFNIADRVIRPLLEDDHEMIADAAAKVQSALNQKANINLKVQKPEVNQDRIDGIIDRVSAEDQYDDIAWMLDEPVINFTQSVVEDFIKANVDFHGKSGLQPKIIRKAERKCCEWCSNLAGEYRYPDVPDDVYRRHERCRCTVEYDPGSGKRQNVHTKLFTDTQDHAKIEARKVVGIRTNGVTIQEVGTHVYDQMAARNVTMESILDALTDPLDITDVKYDAEGRPSFTAIGRKATVAINPDTGKIVTTYPTHTKTANRLLRKKGMK